MKIWIPINGTQQCGIKSPEIHRNSGVDGLSTGPSDLGLTGCDYPRPDGHSPD